MNVAFYADVHVPTAVIEGLRLRGVDMLRAQDDGMEEAADLAILDRATSLGRVVLTQDDDFLAEATRRQRLGVRFSGVVYGHQLRTTVSSLVHDLTLIAAVMSSDEMADHIEYLPF